LLLGGEKTLNLEVAYSNWNGGKKKFQGIGVLRIIKKVRQLLLGKKRTLELEVAYSIWAFHSSWKKK
jgi:multidrug transporter EmrE-like cation transporter